MSAIFRLLLFVCITSPLLSQQRAVDSLERILDKNPNEKEQVRLLNEQAQFLEAIDLNKSRKKAEEAFSLAVELGDQEGIAISHLRIGRYLTSKSSYDSALQRYNAGLAISENAKLPIVQSEALARIGNINKFQGNYSNAILNLNKSIAISNETRDEIGHAFALNIRGLVYLQQSKYDRALEDFEKSLVIRKKVGKKIDVAASLGNVGLVYDYTGNFPSALEYYLKALQMQESIENHSGVAKNWNNIGIVYSMQGESDKALEAFQQAYKLHESTGNKLFMAGSLDNIGINYEERGQYVKALEIYQKTLAVREQIGDHKGIATSLTNIADMYAKQNRYEEANSHYEQALTMLTESGDLHGMADVYQYQGALLFRQEKYKEALELYEKSLQIRQEIGNKDGIANSCIMIGQIHVLNKDFALAEDVYNKALEISRSIGLASTEIYSLKRLANVYLNMGLYQKALSNATLAQSKLKSSNDKEAKQKVHETLAKIYQRTGNFEKAYENQIASTNLKDSILNVETSKQLTQLQVQFETEKKERLISDQEHEITLLATSNQYRTRLTWIGGISALLLFGLVMIYRSRTFAVKSRNLHQHYSRMLLSSHEDERKRISMDLHDSVGQSLMLIKNKIVLSQDKETVTMVSQALEEVRSISKALHPVLLEKLGLTASIQKLVNDYDENTEIFFTEEIDNIDSIFTQSQELHIFRIIQETLNNLVKHSKSPSALVKVINEADKVVVQIKDHGIGFDITEQNDTAKSLGMKTLKERTQILGGKMIIDSVKDKGTSIVLEIPRNGH